MERKKNIFDYCGMVLMQFGFSVIVMMIFTRIFGEKAKDFSAMFMLGKEGLSIIVLLQFLLLTVLIVMLRFVFFTDCIIKKLAMSFRGAFMMVAVLLLTAVFIITCDWFPIDNIFCWIMFVLCFLISLLGTIGMLSIKEKIENKQLDEALKHYQDKGRNFDE
ncbi:MAG: hypothetical protein LUI05_09375 [Oscillospiraceae bacterium]|nr:hypothetical protein [Oscillospiraceae bacterium]